MRITLVAVLVAAAVSAAAVSAAAPRPVPLKTIGGLPTLPKGKPNTTSVVAVGTFDNVLPVVIRNNTKKAVADAKITSTVYSGSKLVGTGSDQGVQPEIIAAGGLAIAYIYFRRDPPAGATFRFNVTTSPVGGSFFTAVDIPVTTASYVDGQVVGIAKNATKKTVSGPLSVYGMCFSANNKIVAMESDFSDADEAPPGAEAPFSLDFTTYGTKSPPACARIIVSMRGYSF